MADTNDLQPTGRVVSVAVDTDSTAHSVETKNTFLYRFCPEKMAEKITKFLGQHADKDMIPITHCFQTENTFLYRFLPEVAEKLTFYVWHQNVMGPVCLLTFAWYIAAILFEVSDRSKAFFIMEIIYFAFFFVYFVLTILTVNQEAFWILIKTFDLWIKVYAAIKIIVASFMYYPHVDLYSERSYIIIYIYRINSTFVVILFSFVDGFNVSWRKFFVFGVILSVLFSITAWRLTFDDRPDRLYYFSENHSLSMVSQIASADRLLSIFLWKQTIKMGWKRGKASVAIKHSAKIKWEESEDTDDKKDLIDMPMSSCSGSEKGWKV
eukprot:598514_1